MSIPASKIVSVNPRLLNAGGSDLEFNGLLLTENAAIPSSALVQIFSDDDSVGDFFGKESDEYKAAVVYFLGYDNSFVKPRYLYIGRLVTEDAAPFLRGGSFSALVSDTLAALQEIAAGDFTMTLGGVTEELSDIDFSSATSLSDAAESLQNAIREKNPDNEAWASATVEYSSLFSAFIITGGTLGEEAGSIVVSGTVADAMLLTSTAAISSAGMDAMTVADNMDALTEVTANWVSFTTVDEQDEETALALASWANGEGVNYLHVLWTTDSGCLTGSSSTVPAAVQSMGYGSTCAIYGTVEYGAFIMGCAASIDWNRRQGAITFAFKAQDGLPPLITKSSSASALESAKINYVGDWAARNDSFIFNYGGYMLAGSYQWIDSYVNAIWLNNVIQVACMNGFASASRVPYNQEGYTMVRAWIQDPINRALYNGVIDTGVTLSESQKAQLYREAGEDISQELVQDGYVLKVGYDEEDDSDDSTEAGVRQNRESPECSLWYTYGGSIHRLEVASTAVV